MSLLLECFGPSKVFQLVSWKIGSTRIEARSVVEIAKTHLSQSKFVLIGNSSFGMYMGADYFEHWATDDAYVKVNCDATGFIIDIGWIVQGVIVILFRFKNLNILCVKQSVNKTTIYLARFLFHNQIVVANSGVCPVWIPIF